MSFDILNHYRTVVSAEPALRLYALVDGLQYEEFTGQRIDADKARNRALFQGTGDAPLAYAGPWLFDTQVLEYRLDSLLELERAKPAVSWLITKLDLDGLFLLLQLKLTAEMPDGKKALLRFYDPRVLFNVFHVMAPEQNAEFFAHIKEWHFLHKGERVWAGGCDA